MKLLMLVSLLASLTSTANADSGICPDSTTELAHCTSDSWLPLYPFAGICKDASGYLLALNAGSGKAGTARVARTETESTIDFATTDAQYDGLAISFVRSGTTAELTYDMLGQTRKSSYSCTGLHE